MTDKESAQNVIDAYRKRQQAARKAPIIVGIAAVLLILGAAFLIFWLLGSNKPSLAFLSTDTPTPTLTFTPTATSTTTSTPTITPTELPSPTATTVPTLSGPSTYKVQEGDTLWSIAEKFKVDLLVLITINNLDPAVSNIRVGQPLIIPAPDTKLPTPTALPTGMRKGTKINYQVQLGDSLLSIALKFNSTVQDIMKENKLSNENSIFVGQILSIPVNMVTPAPTATNTPASIIVNGTELPTAIVPPTSTKAPTAVHTPTKAATP